MPPANKAFGGENYKLKRGPDPFNLRRVDIGDDGGVFGHQRSEDSEIQEVDETIRDAAGEGQYLTDYDGNITESLTDKSRRTQKAMRKRQKERQTGFNISRKKKLILLAGAGVLAGGYVIKKR